VMPEDQEVCAFDNYCDRTQILSELKEFNEHEGRSENLEALKRISPVAWFHINFSGFYSFADSENSHDFSALARTVHLEA
ncbi:hypothetical protein, partial [Bathymodiolus platifrons methanotrophic gill symbiont]|uniref:hypothetical protein n=1 Tax=Bathymodiolus platifrons methanotrophic gill symbiont TaxID=113268 RepID=UPI001C8E76ED